MNMANNYTILENYLVDCDLFNDFDVSKKEHYIISFNYKIQPDNNYVDCGVLIELNNICKKQRTLINLLLNIVN